MIALFCAVALGQVHPVPEEPNLEELLALYKKTEASYWKAVDSYEEHERMEAIINESSVTESHLEKLRGTLETFRLIASASSSSPRNRVRSALPPIGASPADSVEATNAKK
ncbi:MAG: hypothetical protein H6822_25000 [Planctomycetaceae bacterium]|nr:hypothetical protein [Planctomycetales bacterium]MCB9925436.1 hypothetical protein [Planctomycetaceae bacterium]